MANFKLVTEHHFYWPVKVTLPDPDRSGKIETQTLELRFRAMPLAEFIERQKAFQENPAENPAAEDTEFLVGVVSDWRQVENDDGTPAPFTEESFRQALQFPWVRTAAMTAYRTAIAGEVGRKGN